MNNGGRGPTLTQSIKEREDALQKVHSITNGHGIKSTPARLETLSKQIIQIRDKKSLKVPSHAPSQLTEFLLHNPDIIDPDQLDWCNRLKLASPVSPFTLTYFKLILSYLYLPKSFITFVQVLNQV